LSSPDQTLRPLAGRHLAVVDDDVQLLSVVKQALTHAGAIVESWCDSVAALKALQASPPHLAIVDLMMPGIDGLELLAGLRACASTAGLPVVIQTASEDPRSREQAGRLGAAAYVLKPFRGAALIETCRRVLAGEPIVGGGPATPS
jgi:two-component system response regulator ChvI